MMIELLHQDMADQPGAGLAARNHLVGCRCLHNGLAGPAGEFGPDMADNLEQDRLDIEHLGLILTKTAQSAAAGRTGTIPAGWQQGDLLTRQMRRQGTLGWFGLCWFLGWPWRQGRFFGLQFLDSVSRKSGPGFPLPDTLSL
jgi:hypothetical protein